MKFLVFLFSIPMLAADSGCLASPGARLIFQKLRIPDDMRVDEASRRNAQLAVLQKALEAAPADLFLHQRYQDALAEGYASARAAAEYEGALAKHPDDALFLYLAARTEFGHQTSQAIVHLEKALRRDPNFAPPHLLLAEIRQAANFRDARQAAEHLTAYERLCPQSLEAFPALRWSEDKASIAQAAARIRRAVAGRFDGDALEALERLWMLEDALLPSDQQGPWKAQVKTDLAGILHSGAAHDEAWYRAVILASDTAGDHEARQMALEQMAKQFPHSRFPAELDFVVWRAAHPEPRNAPKEQQQAYWKAAWEHGLETIQKWPLQVEIVYQAWRYGVLWEGSSSKDLAAVVKVLRAGLERNPHALMTSPPIEIETAGEMVQREVAIDQVPALVIRGFGATEEYFAAERQSDLYPAGEGRMSMKDAWYLFGYLPLAEAYVKSGRTAEARDSVSQIEDKLAKVKPRAGASAEEKFRYKEMEARYWDVKGELAEKEGRKMDALVDYRTALATFPPRRPWKDTRDEVMARTQRLWKELGGTDRGWTDWAATASLQNFNAGSGSGNAWKTLAGAKPGISFTDSTGKTWTPAELEPRTTLVTIWATWCGPCRAELPYFAKLYQKYKDRKDVALLALNVDDDAKAMDEYLKKSGLAIPSVMARDFAYEFLPVQALPSSWLLTSGKSEILTSDFETGEQWLEMAQKAIESGAKTAR